MKKLLPVCFSVLTTFASLAAIADDKNVLMVLSSYGEKDEQGELIKPGYEFDEMSKSYLVFKAAGINVTFTSPNGGALITDNFDKEKPYNKTFLEDKAAVKKLDNSIELSKIKPANYDAVYVVGGKGPMYDLAVNQEVKSIIKEIYQQQGVVAAVCHGPAALLDIKLNDGSYLVADKRISAFTNLEEGAFTKKWQLPFSLEDDLIAQGAKVIKDGLMLNQVSVDGRLITGQNPFSTADSAIAVVEKLGLPTQGLPTFKDDNTIKLVERFYLDRVGAKQEFITNKQNYNPMLLAMFGFYQSQYASTEMQRNVALMLMELTQPEINHPMLALAIAQTYLDKSDLSTATQLLKQARKNFPDNEQVSELLNKVINS
ncbi:type 1 glutamine amidotransferase domain-containing protein [Thalassotalea maritima]|uniref:type 1 glutamine amidotransferase domain-containing protein n=1 Tax=Thalassotalea maritima TaxID=3242416 RepID=UPI0035275675